MSNRAVVYGLEEGDPLFFDPSGHGDRVYPTVYVLARFPGALETVSTFWPVSEKVIGGADLFLQGFIRDGAARPSFLANSMRALTVRGNPIPFAVGFMAVSSAEAQNGGWQGRGLTVLHTYGDLLWQLGSGAAPNAGFGGSVVRPIESTPGASDGEESDDGAGDAGEAESSGGKDAPAAPVAEAEALDLSDAPEPSPSGVGMDEALESAVLLGLHTLKNAELPIQFSEFFSKHMQPHKPEGMAFDFKQSRYKKLSKLLDKFTKDKVISQKVVRKQDTISAVDREHPLLRQAAGERRPGGTGAAARPRGRARPSKSPAGATIECETVFRVPTSLRPVFESLPGAEDKGSLFSGDQVALALQNYIAAQGPPGGEVKLDATLLSALFGKSKEFAIGSPLPERVLLARLKDKLTLHTRLTRQSPEGPVVVIRKGPLPPIQIAVSKKRGHPITTVCHVDSFGIAAEAFAKDFQKRHGSACTVAPMAGKQEQDLEITMQGELHNKIAEELQRMGVPSTYIQIKGPKKK
ncbi:hypothetical protein QBZ16_004640 [Prototheca wickerhamii]|uniref:SUI1 domain-containing protein n=1 Tax=Prototheca wickerhamii TaxID=3111 RepID=A0AAD9MI43_PROWI|nr:hypothetical protein QBZ16_004640 [Prototheca wickerhamii]